MISALLIAASIQAAVSCHAITSDRIYGRDLAAAESAFSALPPEGEVGFAPIPGQQRVFRPEELTRIARTNHIEGVFAKAVCFNWEVAAPTRGDLLAAMKETLANRVATIEIVDQSNNLLPHGKLTFPLSGLSGSADGPVIWRGVLNYANGRILNTWARVRITVKEQHVASAEVLHAGDELRGEQLKLVDYEGPLPRERHFSSLSEVVGMTPVSTVNAAAVLTGNMLRARKQVERGDLVQVTVKTERTKIEAQGVAEGKWFLRLHDHHSKCQERAKVSRASAGERQSAGGCGRPDWPGSRRGFEVAMRRTLQIVGLLALAAAVSFASAKSDKKKDKQAVSALDEYVQQAHRDAENAAAESPGSLYAGSATLVDISGDLRARRKDDMVTIVVNETASAVSTGATKTARTSNASAAITSAAGPLSAAGRFANLLNMNGTNNLDGSGTTSRTTTLTTTITARVVDVLPNGFLVVEGNKTVLVNSENQVVTVRGVVRPADLTAANTVQSGNVAQMELKINGKGVVNDAVRRPNILYRLLLGVLPF